MAAVAAARVSMPSPGDASGSLRASETIRRRRARAAISGTTVLTCHRPRRGPAEQGCTQQDDRDEEGGGSTRPAARAIHRELLVHDSPLVRRPVYRRVREDSCRRMAICGAIDPRWRRPVIEPRWVTCDGGTSRMRSHGRRAVPAPAMDADYGGRASVNSDRHDRSTAQLVTEPSGFGLPARLGPPPPGIRLLSRTDGRW